MFSRDIYFCCIYIVSEFLIQCYLLQVFSHAVNCSVVLSRSILLVSFFSSFFFAKSLLTERYSYKIYEV